MTYLKASIARALRTVAQTAVALIGTSTVVEAVDWQLVVSGAGLAGLLSLLTSAASTPPEVVEVAK
jgi:hypothetical protein